MDNRKCLENLLLDIDSLNKLKAYTNNTNLFDILKITNAELKHSIVLAYIFNPSESHNLGTKPLELLFRKIAQNSNIKSLEVFDLLNIDYEDFSVMREYKNIDLLLKSRKNKIVICIENKIWTGEHDNQLNRYKEIIDNEYEDFKKLYLYLTPYGDVASDSDNWASISYNDIFTILDELNLENVNNRIKLLIEDYKSIIRRKIMKDDELKELCNNIYRKHKQAIDLIIENKEDDYYYFYSIINEYLCNLKDQGIIIYDEKDSSPKTLRFSTITLEKVFPLLSDTENSFWKNGRTCCYAIEIKDNRLVCELYFSNYFVDKDIQYNKIIEYLNKLHLKPAQNAWKNGYHLNVRFGNIEISSDFMYNNEEEKKDIWSKLDKIMIPVLKNEKETYDRD
ncbi:MAG: PD-(D/E)XK nuclease family protein [Bacilli bacterium]|nr:PD-(D/E)XK nuclease family protein [Bacilli bacterium]